METNRILFTRGTSSQIVLYWYHVPYGTVADPSYSKVFRLASVFRGNDSRSIVKVQVGIPVADSVDETMTRVEPFLRQVEERLAEHLGPGWVMPVAGASRGIPGGP